jgi:hypothetical protein
MEAKETEAKETEAKETEANETEAKETEAKETARDDRGTVCRMWAKASPKVKAEYAIIGISDKDQREFRAQWADQETSARWADRDHVQHLPYPYYRQGDRSQETDRIAKETEARRPASPRTDRQGDRSQGDHHRQGDRGQETDRQGAEARPASPPPPWRMPTIAENSGGWATYPRTACRNNRHHPRCAGADPSCNSLVGFGAKRFRLA